MYDTCFDYDTERTRGDKKFTIITTLMKFIIALTRYRYFPSEIDGYIVLSYLVFNFIYIGYGEYCNTPDRITKMATVS